MPFAIALTCTIKLDRTCSLERNKIREFWLHVRIFDQLGNWPGFVVKAAGTTTLDQTRYHNAVNEIAGNGGNSITASTGTNWADPAYDDAGNTTTMPQPVVLDPDLLAHLRCLEPARENLRRLQGPKRPGERV